MPTLTRVSRLFLEKYTEEFSRFQEAAKEAEMFLTSVLADSTIPIHLVQGRAKSINSLRGKLRHKRYSNPSRQATDLIGVRIITYSWDDLDRVDTEVRNWIDISERKSRDARLELKESKFGYRSVHLIGRLRKSEAEDGTHPNLRRRWFEVQIRSILDHAWSEIEHEVIYKSGIEYALGIKRRFKAVAGALEVLEHAFADLGRERDLLIDSYKHEYGEGLAQQKKFDVARLFAFLESYFPNGRSWRKAEEEGQPFPTGLGVAAVEALEMAKLQNAKRLLPVMKSARFRRAVQQFASQEGLAPETVSHLALLVLAVQMVQPNLLYRQFPEMVAALNVGRSTASGKTVVQLITPA